MLRVMCVNHDDFGENIVPYGPNDPQIGEVCEVLDTRVGYSNDNIPTMCYDLKGYSTWLYDIRNFAPLSDIDETQLVNTKPELTHA